MPNPKYASLKEIAALANIGVSTIHAYRKTERTKHIDEPSPTGNVFLDAGNSLLHAFAEPQPDRFPIAIRQGRKTVYEVERVIAWLIHIEHKGLRGRGKTSPTPATPTPTQPTDNSLPAVLAEDDTEWHTIAQAPLYQVSILSGNVRNRQTREAVPTFGKTYLSVRLETPNGTKDYLCNRLSCTAGHGPPPTRRHQAAHIDDNPRNNAASNLRWKTPKENAADRAANGSFKQGESHKKHKLTDATAWLCFAAVNLGIASARAIAKFFSGSVKISHVTIQKVASGEAWKHKYNEFRQRVSEILALSPMALHDRKKEIKAALERVSQPLPQAQPGRMRRRF